MTDAEPSRLPALRIGEGWDVHALVPGRPLVIGGVTVPHTHGLLGHSDADVLLHAVTDAKGRPLKFFMTAGQVSDYTGAAALLGSLPGAD